MTWIQGQRSRSVYTVVFDIVRAITFHRVYELEYFTELLHWTQGSVMTLITGHWSKIKVTIYIMVKT
jgi:ABC-type enterochelin transport system permease subunit